MNRALVFQHVECEHPGLFRALAAERGVHLDVVALDGHKPMPDPLAYDALLVFGGPMNVDEDQRYPWLASEKQLIKHAVEQGLPYLGVCLGAQLLARALDAMVRPNATPEVGFQQITVDVRDEPLLEGIASRPTVFQWHGDTFDLPAGGVRLATSETCTNQAFRWGSAAFGLQFHVETTREQIVEWAAIPAYRQALEQLYGTDGPQRLLSEADLHLHRVHETASLLFANFCRIIGIG